VGEFSDLVRRQQAEANRRQAESEARTQSILQRQERQDAARLAANARIHDVLEAMGVPALLGEVGAFACERVLQANGNPWEMAYRVERLCHNVTWKETSGGHGWRNTGYGDPGEDYFTPYRTETRSLTAMGYLLTVTCSTGDLQQRSWWPKLVTRQKGPYYLAITLHALPDIETSVIREMYCCLW
jgi:hypothetical protein